jgi:hypothetical protein
LDEWKKLEALGRETQIKNTLKITSPAIGRIRQWKGLPKERSILLAHGHRDKDGVAALPWDVFGKYDAPTAYGETILLGNCVLLAVAVVIDRHRADYQEVFNQLSKKSGILRIKALKLLKRLKRNSAKLRKTC